MDFIAGHIYNRRRDLHDHFKGQEQGGISTPKYHLVIFLFTGDGGAKHGYVDEPKHDGTFHYTGEGRRGDMTFKRGNRSLRDHQASGKQVHLFEALGHGNVRYIGEAAYLGHHLDEQLDTDDRPRQAIVFELELIPEATEVNAAVHEPLEGYSTQNLRSKTLQELRLLALRGARTDASIEERRLNVRLRSDAVRAYVLKRAGGRCEGCEEPAPFVTRQKQPYLEPHHTTRLADGGPDHPGHVIALCPTCHRRVHYAHDGDAYNVTLVDKLAQIEGTE